MDRYYYLASQLPFLVFGLRPSLKREVFLEEVKKWVRGKEFSILSCLDLNDFRVKEEDPPILKEYKKFELGLRKDVSLWRKVKKEGGEFNPEVIPKDILKDADPLEAEKRLLRLRWEFIEERQLGHYSDLEFLILYFLKFQILERLFTFDKEKGKEKFKEICEVKL